MTIICMWQGPKKNEYCNKDSTILIQASCSKGCWSNKRLFACEEHTAIARDKCETDSNYGCGRCGGPVNIVRLTSV